MGGTSRCGRVAFRSRTGPGKLGACGSAVAGWLLATEGCLPSSLGARVRRSSSKITVTDGPFTESTEVVGGFAIFKVNSKEEAIELARQFLKAVGDGECELRQLYEM